MINSIMISPLIILANNDWGEGGREILHWPSGFIRVDKVGVHVFMGSA